VQGVAVGTVKSRVRSGLMQLREVLESAHHGGAR
jgi:DNA-directed RNA polymerase specialized sigma24 family protein